MNPPATSVFMNGDRFRCRRTRWALAALTATTSLAGVWLFCQILFAGGLNVFEILLIPLFTILFVWIAFSFWTATLGMLILLLRRRGSPTEGETPPVDGAAALTQTAILMPIYNESPAHVFANVEAMLRSLEKTGFADRFDIFVLSDTTDPDVWLEEERTWARLVAAQGTHPRVFYRRRPRNVSRKAGNIADFCVRWGSEYEFMIVLDADSLMEGGTLVEMVRRMEAQPQLGILQVPPTPVNRTSMFARLQQFASRLYGPVFIQGFASWAWYDGNYWGHNAIIRVEPFTQHCGLPILPGKPPLGGEILSHDFVEAALMARAGWDVALAYDLGGSYEECPTTLLDYAKRDQRWCQGNMQHIRLVVSENFRPVSRLHLAMGAMSYLSSPLWALFMIVGLFAVLLETDHPFEEMTWGAGTLFAATMAMLLLPKAWALVTLTREPNRLREFGGWDNVVGSVVLETLFSILIAPMMMFFHTRFVIATLLGHSVQWSAQNREEGDISFGEALLVYGPHAIAGAAATLLTLLLSPLMLVWLLPVVVGLLFAAPIALLLGSTRVGEELARRGLLLIPEEIFTPEILHRQRAALAAHEYANSQIDRSKLFETVLVDPSFQALHRNILHASDADVPAPPRELEAILEIIEQEGPDKVPQPARRILLSDAEALRNVHVKLRSQLRLTRSALTS